ncbi:response regulator transcription factor [Roseovarius sp. SYSU LYC5161]|uniref:response regulator transcription factor n=1 Tax=Roseovarius halophilus (ex Wu et al. 2025) TaxID=3376060 RepID=UPI00399BC57A
MDILNGGADTSDGKMTRNESISVLIADDHKMIGESLRSNLLNEDDFDVQVVYNLSETLSTLRNRPGHLDLVLLDISMPGMTGLKSVKQVIEAAAKGAVVIFSGTADQDFIWQAIDLGAKGYIPKAQSLRSLPTTLRLIADGNEFVPLELQQHKRQADDDPADITKKDRLILKSVAEGKTNKEIAIETGKTEITIKMKMRALCSRLGARNRAHAVIIASQKGLI